MTLVVPDASVAAKWYVRERNSDLAQDLLDRGLLFIVPDIFFAELANVLRKHHRDGQLDAQSVRLAVEDVLQIGIESVSSAELLSRALDIALLVDHPIYDCFYLALAERWDVTFVTADERFLKRLAGSGWEARAVLLADAGKIT